MQKLFSDFKPNTAAEWKAQLIRDLKGEAFESLTWHNENGFDIQPFYTAEDFKNNYEPAFTHANWEICVHAKSGGEKHINMQLLQHLNAGATAISLNCEGLDLDLALEGIQLNYIHSTFFVSGKSAAALKTYLEKNADPKQVTCSLFPEKLATQDDLEAWTQITNLFSSFPKVKTISVNTLFFHNQNCLAYYEVALVMAQLNEYIEFFAAKKIKFPATDLVIKTGVSTDYFIQIAKLRAIRRLWALLKNEHGLSNELHLIVETSLTNKSISDSYNNLLRTTVESMAAISGGCNELIVTDFDVLFATNKVLSERMAVNQQLILKEESYFDKMADVACGSFYIESITDAIAAKALETFKGFEKRGGYFKCLEQNIISEQIQQQAKARQLSVDTQKQIVIGVNKFKNEKEKIELRSTQINALENLALGNPVLNYELDHYFKKNA